MVEIVVNGDPLEVEENSTVSQLLVRLKVPREAVAVEINRAIIPKSTHDGQVLQSGDEVEIVTFVGGG